MVAGVYVPIIDKFFIFGELTTVSYSIHRELFPVRTLGRINPKGVTRSGRTIGGSLVFSVFDRHILFDIQHDLKGKYRQALLERNNGKAKDIKGILDQYIISDELPPFNIVISMSNEYSSASSSLVIYGVRITDEGQIMSMEDMFTENQMRYMATGISLMKPASLGGGSNGL